MSKETAGPGRKTWAGSFLEPRSPASRVTMLLLVAAALAIRWGPLTAVTYVKRDGWAGAKNVGRQLSGTSQSREPRHHAVARGCRPGNPLGPVDSCHLCQKRRLGRGEKRGQAAFWNLAVPRAASPCCCSWLPPWQSAGAR